MLHAHPDLQETQKHSSRSGATLRLLERWPNAPHPQVSDVYHGGLLDEMCSPRTAAAEAKAEAEAAAGGDSSGGRPK